MNWSRILTGFFFGFIFYSSIFFGGYLYTIFITIISLITLWEFYKLTVDEFYNIINIGLLIINFIWTILLNIFGSYYLNVLLPLYFSTIVIYTVLLFSKNNKIIFHALNQIAGYVYISLSLSFLLKIRSDNFGLSHSLIIFLVVTSVDIGAYYFGFFFGRHKIAPNISYNKTIEGAIGGLFTGIVFIIFFMFFMNTYFFYNFLFWNFVLFAIAVGIFAQFGDLFASVIKRVAKVKDSSKLLPGHGGFLDRIDSLLLSSPLGYFFFSVLEIL